MGSFQACSPAVFDVGPGIIQIALQVITLASIYLGVTRIQSAVQGQQAAKVAAKTADKEG